MRRILLLFAIALCACRRGTAPAPDRIPVILISVDTLRSDRLPAYGYRGVSTPHLDAFRAHAILFERAYAHVPLTLPSHATMFTGELPAKNGVRDNVGFRLAPEIPTLAGLMKAGGYATGAAVSAFVLRHETGIARGFDFYDDFIDPANSGMNIGRVQRAGEETAAIAQKWIGGQARPVFFFLHLYEPHTPYETSYDAEIERIDAILGRFFASLKASGVYDRALVIVTSDHGEGLGDHGEAEHGILLYREALQVPLLVKLPQQKRSGTSIAAPVPLLDLFATTLRVADVVPPKTASRSLLDDSSPRQVYSETLYPKFHYGWSDLHSLIDRDRHYIEAPRAELYDLATDPAETRNILPDDRRTVASMRGAIAPLIQTSVAPAAVSPEEQRRLSALGYLGSTVTATGDLPDPKDKVASAGELRDVFALYEKGEYARALPLLRRLVRENERMLDVWDILARTLDNLGQPAEAIEAAKRGLRLSPNTTHLALMVARMSITTGNLDDAQKHAELALASEPSVAHDVLARIALARGDLDSAQREAKLALDGKDRVFALMTLGQVALERRNYEEGLQYCDRAIEVLNARDGTAVKGIHFLRGDLLARAGRQEEAEGAFRKEIELFPRDPQAYKNLILLLASEARNDEATALVFQLVDKAPLPPSYAAISDTLRTIGDERGAQYWAAQGLRKFPGNPVLKRLAAPASVRRNAAALLLLDPDEREGHMPDADLDRIISELRRKREQLTEVIDRLVIGRGDWESRDGDGGETPRDGPAREEPPQRS